MAVGPGRSAWSRGSTAAAGWCGCGWGGAHPPLPPYPTAPDSLFVAYYASAEVGCHLALGWPVPERVLDLYAEFRCLTSGLETPNGKGLLGALSYYGLDGLAAAEKEEMRQ